MITKALLIVLAIITLIYAVIYVKDIFSHKEDFREKHTIHAIIIGAVANFFDTLGIGSFAIATTYWKATKSCDDDLVPGTLNAAFGICVIVEAFIFIQRVVCDPVTLVTMIVAAAVGAYVGAKIITGLDISKIRMVLGVCLIVVAIIMACKNAGIGPFGLIGTESGVTGVKLVIAIVANFILGALMMCGIGLYAPCMALVLLLGMSTDVAFPIMMGSCAFLMPVGSIKFIKEGKYDRANGLALTIAGIIGVLIAGFVITSLPLKILTYVVCVALVICAVMYIRDAKAGK